MYQYPLELSFKIITIGPKISVKDAGGNEILFVHMKALKLKEDVRVYRSEAKSQELYQIKADRVIDFSAQYRFTQNGQEIGSIKREGMKSLWSASYNLMDAQENITHHITEDNAMVKVGDAVFGSIPLVGFFSGYVFNPTYTLYPTGGEKGANPTYHLKKQPALFESSFTLEAGQTAPTTEQEEARMLLGIMMMILLERGRG